MNLWQKFQRDFPVLSRIPVLRYWAFGQFARGYEETRIFGA
jgi:hypothetical protein